MIALLLWFLLTSAAPVIRKPVGGVYVIRVAKIGNYYGETTNIRSRWARHRKQLSNNRHHCYRLRRAWAALGAGAFTFEVLEQSEELDANKHLRLAREAFYIASDPLALNTKGNEAPVVTEAALPDRELYRSRTVFLERVPRTQYVNVRERRHGPLLGVELMDTKFRMGTFTTDSTCKLTRNK